MEDADSAWMGTGARHSAGRLALTCALSVLIGLGVISARDNYLSEHAVDPHDAIIIEQAERLISEPNQTEQWVLRSLPDDWLLHGNEPTQLRTTEWFRYTLRLNVPPDRLWGVLLPAVNLNAVVYLNGVEVGVLGRVESPLSHNWNRPLYFSLPSGLLQTGDNELRVKVVTYPAGHGFLGPIYMAPREILTPLYDRLMFINVDLSRFITALSFMMALVLGIIWLLRRQDSEYAWLTATLLFWALHSLKYHVSDVPITAFHFAWFLFATGIGGCCSLFLFLQRLTKQESLAKDGFLFALWGISLTAISIPMALGSDTMYDVAMLVMAAVLTVAVYGIFSVFPSTLRTGNDEAMILLIANSFLAVILIHDLAMIFGYIDRTRGQLTVYAVPILMGAFSIIMLRRFVHALTEREMVLKDLESRAEAAAARVVELEKETALAEQRESIMRDMHDGVGGQLVSSLAMVQRAESTADPLLKDVLQQALTDLRLMIDSLDADPGDLNLLVGTLRHRMQPVLEASGYAVRWHADELPVLEDMNAHNALQVMRIAQEAITNAMKHADATVIDIHIGHDPDDGQISVRIADNGRGFDPQDHPGGRGLLNMETRASELGANLTVGRGASGGTVVTLALSI